MAKATSLSFHSPAIITEYGDSPITTSAEDSLAIPVTHPFVNKTIGADAEACTIANGVPGQTLTVNASTAGGGLATCTPATKTGFTACTLLGAKDQFTVLYIDDTVGWILLSSKGTDAPPVST